MYSRELRTTDASFVSVTGMFVEIKVRVEDRYDAVATLTTLDAEGSEARRLIDEASFEGGRLRLPKSQGGGGNRGMTVYQTDGDIVMVGRRVFSNGIELTGSGRGSSGIRAEIAIPAGGQLEAQGFLSLLEVSGGHLVRVSATNQSGRLTVLSRATYVDFRSQSGDLTVQGEVNRVSAQTMSGDIDLENLYGDAQLSSMSGDISVEAFAPGNVSASTMSGDVKLRDRANLGNALVVMANTMSGRVRRL